MTSPINGARHSVALCIAAAVIACGGDNATSPIQHVQTGPVASRLKLIPGDVDVGVGKVMHVQAAGYDTSGALLVGATYSFSVANRSVASIDGTTGAVTGLTAGHTTLSVTSGSVTTTVPVSVAGLGGGGFKIDLRFGANVSSAVQGAARAAVARWERVITAPLTPYTITASDAAYCGVGMASEVVPNMVIYVVGDSIDGPNKTVGEASPCIIRDPPEAQTTVLGELTVDTADVTSLNHGSLLVDLMTHEMGHILGIGTLWGPAPFGFFPNTATGLGTSDPEYTGQAGRLASSKLGFTTDSTMPVPIENVGGTGTADGHWRETIFKHELMTGTLDDDANPLSRVTIGALADMGYTVSLEAEEDITVNNAGTPLLFSGASGDLLVGTGSGYKVVERLRKPRFTVTRSGVLKPVTTVTGTRAVQ